jgi:hypothetical protein
MGSSCEADRFERTSLNVVEIVVLGKEGTIRFYELGQFGAQHDDLIDAKVVQLGEVKWSRFSFTCCSHSS